MIFLVLTALCIEKVSILARCMKTLNSVSVYFATMMFLLREYFLTSGCQNEINKCLTNCKMRKDKYLCCPLFRHV